MYTAPRRRLGPTRTTPTVRDSGPVSRGLCTELDPDLFFPERVNAATIHAVKSICVDCPIRTACLNQALDNGEQYGIWGGLDERELRTLRRRTKTA
ncbi:WhiB family transcriptional regulator [Streptomyces sp. Qhu_M48]|uniref:WhiB family transcriptional regulator n=1 Tax=Streptomyces sp. Qhu_M48 TaxID=3435889 RepID=UPI003F507FBA